MGLDMYAMATTEKFDQQVDFRAVEASEIYYWRKHPNLHGWLERTYYEQGGEREFISVPVALTEYDLKRLESAIRTGGLPDTEGFFFGRSEGDENKGDLSFISKARSCLRRGLMVYYESWW